MLNKLLKLTVDNPVMVNIVTLTVLVAGMYCAFTIVRSLLPEMRPQQVNITTVYPGAAPEDVERGVTDRIEEVIQDVDGIDRMTSFTTEAASRIVVELDRRADLDRAVEDIKAAIDTIDDFPEEVETPVVTRVDLKWWVISVAVYGDLTDKQLKRLSEDLQDEIRDLAGVSDTVTYGVRDEQINVEVDPAMLQAHRLSLLDVVGAISEANLDVPAGQIRLPQENIAVRTLGERRQAQTIRQIVVRARPDGEILTVGQIARVVDGFADVDLYGRFNGRPAANLTIFRASDQDAINTANKIEAIVDGKLGRPLRRTDWVTRALAYFGRETELVRIWRQAATNPAPPGVHLETHDDISRFVRDRLDLLRRTGMWGLALVFLSLLIFLNRWVAFWVMTGVLLSICGALAVMKQLGLTLNMVSMFGLIVALGLLVDDAIIIAESIYRRVERGASARDAAVLGTQEVAVPVTVAVLTTICAFVPLSMISGRIGDFLRVLPVVAAIALTVSLFEALLLLPSHISEFLSPLRKELSPAGRKLSRWRRFVQRAMTRFRSTGVNELLSEPYSKLLKRSLAYRYATFAIALAALIVSVGVVVSRRVESVSFPKMDSDFIFAGLRMPIGTAIEQTELTVREVEKAAAALPEAKHYYTLVGGQASQEEPTMSAVQSHLAQVFIELIPMEQRTRTSDEIVADLRRRTEHLTGIDSLQFATAGGPHAGADVAVEVRGDDLENVLPAIQHLKDRLAKFAGVYEIRDDFEAGRREMKIELLPSARGLGLTTRWVSQQIRSAFQGLEARTIQRRREAVDIVVRYGRENRSKFSDLDSLWISTPIGTRVPLREVAIVREGVGYAGIHHTDRRRAVTVFASVDPAVGNADEIMDVLESEYSAFSTQHGGVGFTSTGSRRETAKALSSIGFGFAVALMLIYVCLACLFRSYVQPLIVMISIPMGFIGVVLGHWLMGYPLTILSRIGFVALAGIAVNDALILVDYANRLVRDGATQIDAIYQAGLRRLRPIILTSLTTILGLAPLMAERSFQARFLIPMAISITFGLALATFLTLVLVPSLYLMVEDFRRFVRWVWYGPGVSHSPIKPAAAEP